MTRRLPISSLCLALLVGCGAASPTPATSANANGKRSPAKAEPAPPPKVAAPQATTSSFAALPGMDAAVSTNAGPGWAKTLRAAPGKHDAACYDDSDANGVELVTAEVSAEHAGPESVVVSLADGVALYNAEGGLIARSGPLDCLGSQTTFGGGGHVAVGQVVPDKDAEIVVTYQAGGRRLHAKHILVFKRAGTGMKEVFSGFAHVYTGPDKSKGSIELTKEGTLVYRAPGQEDDAEFKFSTKLFSFRRGENVEVVEIEGLQKKACACGDNACAKLAFTTFTQWISKNKKKKISRQRARRVGEASKNITTCLMKHGIKPGEIMKALRSATK